MSSTVIEILIILILIVANGVFAMAEAAVISARKARLQQRANEGNTQAAAALKLAEAPNTFLATVQIGITLIGVLTGAFGGAALADPLAAIISQVEFLRPQSEALAFALVVIVTTYLSLIIGELVPKQLALNNPELIAGRMAGPMGVLSRLTAPVVKLLDISTNLVLRLLNVKPSEEPGVTEEEIKVMIDQGTAAGEFEQTEREILGRVFRLADLRVEAIITPRIEVNWLDVNDSPDSIRQTLREFHHARFPVAQDSLDNVLGIVQAKDILSRMLSDHPLPLDLRSGLQPPLFVPGSVSVLKMLERFREAHVQMALVLDEYGGLQGIVTLTDVIEKIIGGGYITQPEADQAAVQRPDGSWLLDGMMPITEFKEVLKIRDELPGEAEGDYQTLGGFMMHQIGHIPVTGAAIDAATYRFEVVDMDGHRVDKVLVSPAPSASSV